MYNARFLALKLLGDLNGAVETLTLRYTQEAGKGPDDNDYLLHISVLLREVMKVKIRPGIGLDNRFL
jgi:hypothetical protein